MLALLIGTTTLIVLATLLPLWRSNPHWMVRGFDYPRLQIACLAVILLPAQLFLLDLNTVTAWLLIAVTALAGGWQLWWILPYTRLWQVEVLAANDEPVERQLSILTSNVLTENRNAEALIRLVNLHRPDILVTLESDQWWEDRLASIETDMPFSMKCPLDNLYGMHVYSRLPLSDTEICYLVEDDVPSMHAQVTLRSGDKIRVHFLHPSPPSPSENTESEERDAELIIVGRSVADSDQPAIVTGDLNDVAWSATTRLFREVSGLLDPRIGRGMFNTFHAHYPFLRWPLDHIFHSDHFSLRRIERLPSISSDHFPLLTCLCFTPANKPHQDGLEADKEDQQWASRIVNSQSVSKQDVPEPGE